VSLRTISPRKVLACGASAAAVILAAGAPAHAADAITGQVGNSPASVGDIMLQLAAPTVINSFTAHIVTAAGTDVLNLPESDFTLTSGTTTAGTWTITSPLTTGQLLLGTYSVTLDATDTGGDSVAGESLGTFGFLIQPTVTLTASPGTLDPASPTSTLSGTVTGLYPDGSTEPLAGVAVLAGTASGLTNSSGDFSMQVATTGTFSAQVYGTTTMVGASSPQVTITADTEPTQLTISVSTATPTYGQVVTVSGTLTGNPGSGYVGLGGMPVPIDVPGYPGLLMPVTSSNGSFTESFTVTASGSVEAYFNESGNYPLVASAEATSSITDWLPTYLTGVSASLAPSGLVTVRGCLGVASIWYGSAFSIATPIQVQYSASPDGPWKVLGRIQPSAVDNNDTGCGMTMVEAGFTGTFKVQLARAYYRVYYPGVSSYIWLPSASQPVLKWRYSTEIRSWRVSPRQVAAGGRIKFSGQLMEYVSGWKPLGRQVIEIIYRRPGRDQLWYWIVKVRTNAQGKFTANVKDPFTAQWSAFYAGGAAQFNASPAAVKVAVR
jgi:hypothetical protein